MYLALRENENRKWKGSKVNAGGREISTTKKSNTEMRTVDPGQIFLVEAGSLFIAKLPVGKI